MVQASLGSKIKVEVDNKDHQHLLNIALRVISNPKDWKHLNINEQKLALCFFRQHQSQTSKAIEIEKMLLDIIPFGEIFTKSILTKTLTKLGSKLATATQFPDFTIEHVDALDESLFHPEVAEKWLYKISCTKEALSKANLRALKQALKSSNLPRNAVPILISQSQQERLEARAQVFVTQKVKKIIQRINIHSIT